MLRVSLVSVILVMFVGSGCTVCCYGTLCVLWVLLRFLSFDFYGMNCGDDLGLLGLGCIVGVFYCWFNLILIGFACCCLVFALMICCLAFELLI